MTDGKEKLAPRPPDPERPIHLSHSRNILGQLLCDHASHAPSPVRGSDRPRPLSAHDLRKNVQIEESIQLPQQPHDGSSGTAKQDKTVPFRPTTS